jgi:glycosyltransferase involved in cell wall biosynthesis
MNKNLDNVWIIMPVYNEEEAVPLVINEWMPLFKKHLTNFVFCILNDGSKDKSFEILNEMATKNPEILVVNKANSGHGQSWDIKWQLKKMQNGFFKLIAMDNAIPIILKLY